MNDITQFLFLHGYSILFAGVSLSQAGIPIPAVPILITAGTIAGMGQMDFYIALFVAFSASTSSDIFRYYLGRRLGNRVLVLLCRLSLEPDSCVRQTEDLFGRHGAKSLIYCKFVPGLDAVVASMSGIVQMRFSRFFAFNSLGTLLWITSYIGIGYIFSDALDDLLLYASHMGRTFFWLLMAALAIYIAWKYFRRVQFIHELSISRITPEELKSKLDTGEDITVIDLRSSLDFKADPYTIPGAIRMAPENLTRRDNIPLDQEVVLYCT
jgi:membrane protein DedA with SNARE-associated domain